VGGCRAKNKLNLTADPVSARSNAWVCDLSFAGLRVRMRPGAWMSVSCDCYVLSGRGLCDGSITHEEVSYQKWCF